MKNLLGIILVIIIFVPCWMFFSMLFEVSWSLPYDYHMNIGRAMGSFVAAYLSIYLTSKIVKKVNCNILFWTIAVFIIVVGTASLVILVVNRHNIDSDNLLIIMIMDVLVISSVILGAYLSSKKILGH